MPSRLGIVEVAIGIGLQPHREFVEMFRDLLVIVKALDEVGFTVVVQIAQNGDLVSTRHINLAIDELQAEWLKQSVSNAARMKLLCINPADNPDVAIPRTDRQTSTVRKEVESSQPHLSEPGIVCRNRQNVDRERAVVRTSNHVGVKFFEPPSWPS